MFLASAAGTGSIQEAPPPSAAAEKSTSLKKRSTAFFHRMNPWVHPACLKKNPLSGPLRRYRRRLPKNEFFGKRLWTADSGKAPDDTGLCGNIKFEVKVKMLKYILKRLVYVALVFFIISIIMFVLYKFVPGDPALMMIDSSKQNVDPVRFEQMYQAARERLGLDKPLPIQYISWITNMLTGDFGYSSQYRMPVKDMVSAPLMNTLQMNLASMVLVFLISIPLGIVTAVRKNGIFDNTVQVTSVVGYSLPGFVIALLCIFAFAVKLPIFPISGVNTAGLTGTSMELFLDKMHHMALPVIVTTLSSIGMITRYVRGAMIDVLEMDYIRTARAKGLREKVVVYVHAFRNALIPIITIMTSWIVTLFSGSVVIERLFLWNGLGNVLYTALMQRDFMVVLTMQMFYVVLALVGNLIMDLTYCLVDPRVKLEN